jgi:hypothetical protein
MFILWNLEEKYFSKKLQVVFYFIEHFKNFIKSYQELAFTIISLMMEGVNSTRI